MLAVNFSLPDQEGTIHTLGQYRGKWVLIYFYPKDDTPGCTIEACSFRDMYKDLQDAGICILGISKDTVTSHKKFAQKFTLPFPLLSDTSKETIDAYHALAPKTFMGKTYLGIIRKSFLIDPKGEIKKEYTDIDVGAHAKEILADVETFSKK